MGFLVAYVCVLGIMASLAWDLPQQVQDTPEVAAAKAAHIAALAKAKEKARKNTKYEPDGTWSGNELKGGQVARSNEWEATGRDDQNDDGSWRGDDTWKNYDDGSWQEDEKTTEAPKAERKWDGNERWTGPVALPPGYDETGAPLPVEDTPEVAAAKAKHLLLYAKAVSRSHPGPPQAAIPLPVKHNHQQPRNNALFTPVPVNQKLRSPPARSSPPPFNPAPVWETNDEVHDTPEVAAAKAAHYAAHARRRV